jgi:hypothetical protein
MIAKATQNTPEYRKFLQIQCDEECAAETSIMYKL